jgi:glutamine synthetase
VEENIYKMSNAKQKRFEIRTLPRNLEEALRMMDKSPLLRETLGDHVYSTFIANKRTEIDEYNAHVSGEFEKQVSDYEVKKYLPFL